MSMAAETALAHGAKPGVLPRAWGFGRRHLLTFYGILALGYLLLPIART